MSSAVASRYYSHLTWTLFFFLENAADAASAYNTPFSGTFHRPKIAPLLSLTCTYELRSCTGFYFAFLGHLATGLIPLGLASIVFQYYAAREIFAGDRLYAPAIFVALSIVYYVALLDS